MTRRRNREVYPHVEEQIGEDPARFLDRELDSEVLRFIESRISGIDRLEVLAAWGDVERNLIRTPDGSYTEAGRDRILDLLEQRARELETLGEREDRLERRREVVVDDQDDVEDEPTVWRHTAEDCGSTDVEQLSASAWRCDGCDMRVPKNRVEVVEPEAVPA